MAAKARMLAALGARGTGKTAWATMQPEYTRARRLIVWDLMREAAHQALPHFDNLAEFIRAMDAPAFRLAFNPSPDDDTRGRQFDLFMRAALQAKNLTVHVEELAFVTTASKAPPAWRRACLLGRHSGVSIVGTSQRPAQVDKEFFGNLDVLHCGRLMGADADTAARALGVRPAELEQLPDLHFVEREGAAMRSGVLTFGASSVAKSAKKPAPGRPRGKAPKGSA